MSFTISGKAIRLTRGDTLRATIHVIDEDAGEEWQPQEGDSLRFRCTKKAGDQTALIERAIPTDTMLLELEPEDTSPLKFGSYFYDIEATLADGTVDTVIPEGTLEIAPEADPMGA